MNLKRSILFPLALLIAHLSAQTPAPPTAVMVGLTIKPGIERADVMKVMPDEIRATVQLHLDGKIQQWYSRSDGKGVVFIMNCTSVQEAKALMETLPLSKANYANLEFT